MKKRTIALNLRNFNYTGLYIFAQDIHDKVQSMPALFPSPVPSLSVFQTSIDKMSDAITKYGKKGSVGGEKEYAALLLARDILRGNLKGYARYVMATQPDDAQLWEEVGFVLKKLPAKTGRMEAVQNLHQFIARNIPFGQIKLKWKRPLAAPAAMMITYVIRRSEDKIFSDAVIVGTTVNKATFMDTPPKIGVVYYYWVIPVSTMGDGVPSEVCSAFASPV